MIPRAIVVGGSKGIGNAIAATWSSLGFETHVFSRTEPENGDENKLLWHHIDLNDPAEAKQVLADSRDIQPKLVCYSAVNFTSKRQPLFEVDDDDWHSQFNVNTHGLYSALRIFLPTMTSDSAFLHISSEVAYNGGPRRIGYAATKAAASTIVNSLAEELADNESVPKLIQAMPAEMVDTPGIRVRRPSGFDYSDFMRSESFSAFAAKLASSPGSFPENEYVVYRDGSWAPLSESVPPSQSNNRRV